MVRLKKRPYTKVLHWFRDENNSVTCKTSIRDDFFVVGGTRE